MTKTKIKSNKSAAKRFRVTKNGKVLFNKKGRRHILTKKTPKRKRQLRNSGILKECEAKRIRKMLPYG